MLSPDKNYVYLITGVCGFIGSTLAHFLLKNNCIVFGIDIKEHVPQDLSENKNFTYFLGREKQIRPSLSRALEKKAKKSVMVHCAGIACAKTCDQHPEEAYDANVLTTIKFINMCCSINVSRFVFLSTGHLYGNIYKSARTEDSKVFCNSVYTTTKFSAEKFIELKAPKLLFPSITIRLSNVYGMGCSSNTVIGSIIQQINDKKSVTLKDSAPIRDFIHVDDVVSAIIILIRYKHKKNYELFNVSSGYGVKISKLLKLIRGVLKQDHPYKSDKMENKSTLILCNKKIKKNTTWYPQKKIESALIKMVLER